MPGNTQILDARSAELGSSYKSAAWQDGPVKHWRRAPKKECVFRRRVRHTWYAKNGSANSQMASTISPGFTQRLDTY